MNEYVLCYVEQPDDDNDVYTAYFTNESLEEQWGDDWNDAPYDCNAGTPYSGGAYGQIVTTRFKPGNLETPADMTFNTPFSVQDINGGIVAWLFERYKRNPVVIRAGATIEEFKQKVREAGGEIDDGEGGMECEI